MAITDWPIEQRPRERLLKNGCGGLTDAELLALVLRVGTAGKSAVDLGHEMLEHFGSLNALFAAPLKEFASLNGLGPAKFAMFQAVFELAQRALAEEMKHGSAMNSPLKVRQYLQLELGSLPHETFVVLHLDAQNRLINCEELFRGTLTHTSVYPREVVKAALACNAAGVILAHNHPSGNPAPSHADRLMTQALQTALAVVEVRILDHVVVAGGKTYSFAEHGDL